ncbi:MAG: bifunctional 4-hydroxy-2-oxoglutarate aldolase/2-dehydro-3-deoxy-phosphogluconate aldolase [Phycisphaerae bacterium]
MSDVDKADTLATIRARRVSAIIRTDDATLAADAMTAAVDGGFRVVEFTLTTPAAIDLIARFAQRDDLLVGAGTVLSPDHARDAARAGARFLVSPVCDPDVIREAARLGVVSIPGTFTPTEMLTADRSGADILKVFPSPGDVAGHVRAVLGPLPHLRLFPTAGVTIDNFLDVLRAGAFGVGFVRPLFDPQDMARRNLEAIRQRAKQIFTRLADLPAPPRQT